MNVHLRILALILLTSSRGIAQIQDNFSDGDFTNNPTWIGETVNFDVNANRLHLNAPAVAASAYLSTASNAVHNASWEFYVEMGFATSSTSLTRVYLMSDQSDLKQSLNGYFVMIGNTTDEVSLYKQSGTTITKIIDGLDSRVGASTVKVKIKATRDATGLWSLFVDVNSTGTYTQEAAPVTDISYTISNYFGVYCLYTSTRSTLFYLDDFNISGTPIPDLTPPTLVSAQAINQNSVLVNFSEALDPTSAQTATNYAIDNSIGNPASAVLQADNKSVILNLSSPLTNGLNYNVQVSSVKDVVGNAMTTASNGFQYFLAMPVSKKDIIVSEFMADPSPPLTLPDAEFVELFNRSSNPIDLMNWKLSDGTTTATLPHFILMPSAWCVITTTTAASQFTSAMGVANFPSLNNSGDNIIIRDDNNLTIDSIAYNLNWYHDVDKKDGGWSLEIIDPENICGEETNWTDSVDGNGGTPGLLNSVNAINPDVTAPQILSTIVNASGNIEITFDEKMDGQSVPSSSISPAIAVSNSVYSSSLRKLVITPASTFQPSIPYTVILSNAFDCAGNGLIQNSFQFVLTESPQSSDLLVNEILFNPKTGGVDFLEIYNNSSKYISLKKFSIANNTNNSVTNPKVLPGNLIIPPHVLWAFTPDPIILKALYPKTVDANIFNATLPSFLDDAGSVALVDSLGNVIDDFQYDASYHKSTLPSKEGVSLERISYNIDSNLPSNWESGAASDDYASPGYKNIASYPHILNVVPLDAQTVRLDFSEPVDPVLYVFDLNPLIYPSAYNSGQSSSSIMVSLASAMTNGLSYTLNIAQIKAIDGDVMFPVTLSFQFFVPTPVSYKDIIISEFMADPTPPVGLPEAEFVELFNRSSNPIDLMNWKLSDGSTTATLPHFILLPSSRCVVTTTTAAPSFSQSIGVVSFPSLNNTGDNIIIKNALGVTIDSITYTDNWYHSDEKKDGGWSLEIIDPENLCEEEGNWTGSENTNGGTPAIVNSVLASNPDVMPPQILSAIITNSTSVEISFNEKLDGNPLTGGSFNPSKTIVSIQYANHLRKIIVKTSESFEASTPLILTLSNVADCAGNPLTQTQVKLVLPEVPTPNDILINEVLFNPKSGGVDFIEIFNVSHKYFNLKKWSLSNFEDNSITNTKTIASDLLIAPQSYMVFTPDQGILKSQYARTVDSVTHSITLPSMPDDEGSIAIIDSLGNIIDYFLYKDNYHSPFLKDKEGISLERVSLATPANDINNWRSASQFENFATPGYRNSASTDGVTLNEGEVTVEPEIFTPQAPSNDFTKINYHFEQSGYLANVNILDQQGRIIKTLASNEVLGVEGFLRWEGDRDDGGRARAGYYIAWMEVFNNSGKLNVFRKRVIVMYR